MGVLSRNFVVFLLLLFTSRTLEAAEPTGVVLIHGKTGSPAQLHNLAVALHRAGYEVQRPEMCWSSARIYDRAYLDCLIDVDTAVANLRREGATAIVITGMSLGGNAALAYGARRTDLSGIIALAPAPDIELVSRQPAIAKSLSEAEAMIADGRGDQSAIFSDINVGRIFKVKTTANIYVSFLGPNSPGNMSKNAEHLKVPLLLVSGTDDPSQSSSPTVFKSAPSNPLSRYVTVDSDHLGTPAASGEIVLDWLKALSGR